MGSPKLLLEQLEQAAFAEQRIGFLAQLAGLFGALGRTRHHSNPPEYKNPAAIDGRVSEIGKRLAAIIRLGLFGLGLGGCAAAAAAAAAASAASFSAISRARASAAATFSASRAALASSGGIALAGFDLLGAGVGQFEDTRRLTATIAQVVELGATHLAALQHFDAVDVGRQHGEHAFHAFAVGNLADGEALVEPGAGAGDDDAFIGLEAFLLAFANLHPHLDGIAMGEIGVVGLGGEAVELLFLELGNDIGHA